MPFGARRLDCLGRRQRLDQDRVALCLFDQRGLYVLRGADADMTREEFFMYLTIGLIVIAPVVVRLYRRATMKRTTQMLRDQLEGSSKDS